MPAERIRVWGDLPKYLYVLFCSIYDVYNLEITSWNWRICFNSLFLLANCRYSHRDHFNKYWITVTTPRSYRQTSLVHIVTICLCHCVPPSFVWLHRMKLRLCSITSPHINFCMWKSVQYLLPFSCGGIHTPTVFSGSRAACCIDGPNTYVNGKQVYNTICSDLTWRNSYFLSSGRSSSRTCGTL